MLRSDFEEVKQRQVSVISGGGSGHEPAMGGYIGEGGLTAAVAGGVFASPSVYEILCAIRAATGPHGALVIIMNYTGDRLNFGLACEQARNEGYAVELVIVSDDCALLERDEDRIVGPRGVAGTVLVHKIAGAAAAAGASLAEVAAIARETSDSAGTVGVALEVCTIPGQEPSDRLAATEIELGLGIHGEPGTEVLPAQPVDGLVDRMVGMIQSWAGDGAQSPPLSITSGDSACLLVNNLGATPPMELYIVARRAIKTLSDRGVEVPRVYIGSFMTSLNMPGMSLTLLKLPADGAARETTLARLDSPTTAPGWVPAAPRVPTAPVQVPPSNAIGDGGTPPGPAISAAAAAGLRSAITAAAEAVVAAEDQLTEWDRVAGDGDAGITFRRGAEQVLADVSEYIVDHPCAALEQIADSIREAQGGTSVRLSLPPCLLPVPLLS